MTSFQDGIVANSVLIGGTNKSISGLAPVTNGNILTVVAGVWAASAPATSGTVTSVSGTANQVNVTNGTTAPVISLIGPYTPTSYTAHGVLIGNTTSSIAALSAGLAGQILQSGGASADPAYSTATYPSVGTSTGSILRADGTNWSATTTTYPNTNAINTILYASAANVMSALATANNGVHVTSNTGVPSVLAGPGTTGNIFQSNAAAAPSFSTATYPSVGTSTGSILRADGTNWSATTSTYPNTNAISTLLYASAANVMSALATANNGMLVTSSTGVPSILAGPGTTGNMLQSNAAAAPSFSTTTYPATNAISTLLYASAANVMSALATANNGLLVTSSTGVPSILVGPGATGRILQSNAAAAPSFSTATYPSTGGTAGKILISDGTNIVSSTPTYPNASATAGKVIVSDGTNFVASTPTFPNASATSGKFIRSDGTNWIASTPTLPTTGGTTDTLLRSDGTNWVNTSAFKVSSADVYTNTAQPAAAAFVHTAMTNATGDGTVATVIFDSKDFDQGTNYSTVTGQFTVPTGGGGLYLVTTNITFTGVSASFTSGEVRICTNSATLTRREFNPATSLITSTQCVANDSYVITVTAGQTIFINVLVSGSTKTVGILADSFGKFSYVSFTKIA